ncbi:hypothetical protein [Nocardia amikacinitolerans]|uniref:hypothetical protein n=1 Tax=Nocardia amikacinitolerans TaxID=756689 RepID=UPI0020A2B4C4|nr:hypothetical protein [Nocardia amikacinitolerans]MCP2281095.1 hypothetical protein [Nocardia amikacinitolerans]MCP2298291.1 hypothetical protein [Nocardia amikacinitolerans]
MTQHAHSTSVLEGAPGVGTRMPRPASPLAGHHAPAADQRPSEWHPGMLWWDAATVLVTYPTPSGTWQTVAHLVIPIDHGRLAFRVPAHSAEAQQLSRDRRVIVQAGDWRGTPALGSRQHQGAAEVIFTGPLYEQVQTGIRTKYGPVRTGLANLARRFAAGATTDLAAIVTLHENPPYRTAISPPSS